MSGTKERKKKEKKDKKNKKKDESVNKIETAEPVEKAAPEAPPKKEKAEEPPAKDKVECVDSETWDAGVTCKQLTHIYSKNEQAGKVMCKEDGAVEHCPKACRVCDETGTGKKTAHDEL